MRQKTETFHNFFFFHNSFNFSRNILVLSRKKLRSKTLSAAHIFRKTPLENYLKIFFNERRFLYQHFCKKSNSAYPRHWASDRSNSESFKQFKSFNVVHDIELLCYKPICGDKIKAQMKRDKPCQFGVHLIVFVNQTKTFITKMVHCFNTLKGKKFLRKWCLANKFGKITQFRSDPFN